MGFRLQKGDYKIVEYLAEYRILTMTQLAVLLEKNKPVIRKRFRDLKKEGLIRVTNNEFGRNFGRPEELLGLSEEGVEVLREKNLIGNDIPYENVGPVTEFLSTNTSPCSSRPTSPTVSKHATTPMVSFGWRSWTKAAGRFGTRAKYPPTARPLLTVSVLESSAGKDQSSSGILTARQCCCAERWDRSMCCRLMLTTLR